jgi:serine/threonine protein kinase
VPIKPITPSGLRPPELIFGETYDHSLNVGRIYHSLDIWSFGCLVFEFITGRQLFLVPSWGYDKDEQQDVLLLQMTDILGPLPDNIFKLWRRAATYFNKDQVQFNSYLGGKVPKGADPLGVKRDPLETFFNKERPQDISEEETKIVTTLIRRILQYDPEKRPAAEELLQDPWFAN